MIQRYVWIGLCIGLAILFLVCAMWYSDQIAKILLKYKTIKPRPISDTATPICCNHNCNEGRNCPLKI